MVSSFKAPATRKYTRRRGQRRPGLDWQDRFRGGRPAVWWAKVFEKPPHAADYKNPGACFSCTEAWTANSAVGDATLYEVLPLMARTLGMPSQVLVHNVCAFGFETDLLRRIKRRETFAPAHLMAYRSAEAKLLRSAVRTSIRMA